VRTAAASGATGECYVLASAAPSRTVQKLSIERSDSGQVIHGPLVFGLEFRSGATAPGTGSHNPLCGRQGTVAHQIESRYVVAEWQASAALHLHWVVPMKQKATQWLACENWTLLESRASAPNRECWTGSIQDRTKFTSVTGRE
jgi:hypothetical protein